MIPEDEIDYHFLILFYWLIDRSDLDFSCWRIDKQDRVNDKQKNNYRSTSWYEMSENRENERLKEESKIRDLLGKSDVARAEWITNFSNRCCCDYYEH